MKRGLIFALATIFFASEVYAAKLGAPFIPEEDERFNTLEIQTGTLFTDSSESLRARRYAHVIYNFATEGGAVASIPLGVVIPAKAIFDYGFVHVKTQPVKGTGTTSTFALSCASAGDILAARDLTTSAAGSIFVLGPAGLAYPKAYGTTMGNYGPIAGACELSATIAATALTAGKLDIFLDYYVAE